jgi:subtilisin-like proprotein convertase family protein
MKKNMMLGGLVLLALVQTAVATIVVNQDWTVNQVLPDNNSSGYAASQTFSGLDASAISQVDVRLNISGGYNGDLYGYLTLQDAFGTYTSILLNRVGRTDASGFGYAAAGMNVTLSGDTAQSYQNIHDVSVPGTGTYFADGRAINPNGNFSGATSTAGLEVLNGHTANGTWTLFLADLSGGDQSTLVSWGLDISVVPEPSVLALTGAGLMAFLGYRRLRRS